MIRSSWLLVLLAIVAVARLTRLINEDAILDRPRAWVQSRGATIAYFVQCPWCVSIWVGAGVAATTYNWPWSWWVQIPLIMFAASYLTAVAALLVAKLEA